MFLVKLKEKQMTKIFLDGGTHLGGGIKAISKKEGINKDWRVYSWEANPYTYKKNLEDQKRYSRFNIQFFNKALSTHNGHIEVMIQQQRSKHTGEMVNTGQGTTILSADDFKNPDAKLDQIIEKVKIPCIDFSQWINANTTDNDEIIIKLDIEGAEYELLEHLLKSPVLNRIKKMYIEWHSYAMKDKESLDKRQYKIESICKENNIEIISWV